MRLGAGKVCAVPVEVGRHHHHPATAFSVRRKRKNGKAVAQQAMRKAAGRVGIGGREGACGRQAWAVQRR